jgi:hypothetical protein
MSNWRADPTGASSEMVQDFRARGERCGRAKLTQLQVSEIRRSYQLKLAEGRRTTTMSELARVYGVSKMQISRILNRRQWVHVG